MKPSMRSLQKSQKCRGRKGSEQFRDVAPKVMDMVYCKVVEMELPLLFYVERNR